MSSALESRAFRAVVGERIRLRRLSAGLSQEGLGLAAERDRSYIGSIERGEKAPTIDTLFLIARALEVPVEHLLAPVT